MASGLVASACSVRRWLIRCPSRLLHPHPRTPGPAAHPLAVVKLHLGHLLAGDCANHAAALVEDIVVAPQVAGVVVGDHGRVATVRLEPALGDQPVEQLGVVDHLDAGQPELRVLVADAC